MCVSRCTHALLTGARAPLYCICTNRVYLRSHVRTRFSRLPHALHIRSALDQNVKSCFSICIRYWRWCMCVCFYVYVCPSACAKERKRAGTKRLFPGVNFRWRILSFPPVSLPVPGLEHQEPFDAPSLQALCFLKLLFRLLSFFFFCGILFLYVKTIFILFLLTPCCWFVL